MDTKDQIKEKLDIVDVVASYIQLKKAGSNYRARCPFHGEKTPSFMVSPAKQMFYCFGCNAGGDIFSFVQKIENCDFLESVKTLAPRAGVSLEKMQFDKDSGIKSRLKEMSQRSAMLYHKILTGNPAGQRALAYLKGRGLTDETIQRWTIGFAPLAWDTLTKALKSKNYTESEIVMAGLAVKNDKGRVYDRFRGRITFPVANSSGEIIGYSARLLDEGDEKAGGKYINTPETQIYHKSAILFGYDKAKKEAAAKNALILMEGNLDVILSHQAGVQNAVGVSGTGLSSEQLKLISRLTDTLNLCFDADSAGERAAERSLSLSSEYDFNINFIVLPKTHKGKEIKDPADLASIDAEAWQKASQNAIPMMEHLLDTLIKKTNLNDPQQKKKAIDKYMGYIISLRNSIDQHHWLSKCAQRFGEPENILQEKLPKNKTVKAVQQPQSNTAKNRSQRIAELLYSSAISYSQHRGFILENLELEMAENPDLAALAQRLKNMYNTVDKFDLNSYSSSLEQEEKLKTLHTQVALLADKEFFDLADEDIANEIVSLIDELRQHNYQLRLKILQSTLLQAEKDGDKNLIGQTMNQISELSVKIKK